MDGWTLTFVLVFGVAALIPAVWSIVAVVQGKSEFWPAVVGTGFAVLLMILFSIGLGAEWGRCDTESAGNAVRCSSCASAPWIDECGATARDDLPACRGVAVGQYCPSGERPVFDFCERFSDGLVKQPWSTWSDLSFIAAGLWILWFFGFFRYGTAANPMRDASPLSITYGMIVIFMGPPSMLLHASMQNWGGWFDSMSVVIWLAFNAAYVFYTLFWAAYDVGRNDTRTVTVLTITGVFVALYGLLGWFVPSARLFGYIVAGGLWGISEVWYLIQSHADDKIVYRRNPWLFGSNFLLLGTTMTIWVLFNAGVVSAETCQARESFPGHALFHILASFSTMLTIVSFASEKRVRSEAGGSS